MTNNGYAKFNPGMQALGTPSKKTTILYSTCYRKSLPKSSTRFQDWASSVKYNTNRTMLVINVFG